MNDREFNFTRKHFDDLRQIAQGHAGIQVSAEKYDMYYARLTKRLRLLKISNFDDYVRLVKDNEAEFLAFINAITTNVTAFDREPHHFEFLKHAVQQQRPRRLRIWSAGCSSGEEPYSIIVNLYDICKKNNTELSILATDLDTDMLNRGQNGIYPIDSISNYDNKAKRKFFRKGVGSNDGKARVKPEYRSLITFKKLNLIKEWSHNEAFDAIFCRNVMIYFSPEDKKKLVNRYYQHLRPGGYLFLGHSESLHQADSSFTSLGKTIYERPA